MKKFLLKLVSFEALLLFFLVEVSIATWFYFYSQNLTLIYNDEMAHLNLSRLVVDNMEPGISQLGGVWLPMNHVLSLPFIWNYWAWQTGLAGTVVSMVSFVMSAFGVYLIIKTLTKNKLAGLIASVAVAFNLNALYLQSTSLTESLYLGLFVFSSYFFVKWIVERQTKYLLMVGLFGFLQVLTRYDGWFVVATQGLIILIDQLFIERLKFKAVLGKLILFGFPIAFGVLMWLLWNLLIFHDPLFFALGPYSARAQQAVIEQNAGGLLTKGNWGMATLAYFYAIVENIGVYLFYFGLLGAALFITQASSLKVYAKRILIILFLLGPVIFNILSLYLGFSILNLPELNWNPSDKEAGLWFNVRYGIFALPFVAVMVGLLANRMHVFAITMIFVILFQSYVTFNSGIITIIDGYKGSSSFVNQDIAKVLKENVHPNERMLISTSFFSPVAFKSGVELQQMIHEGVSQEWPYAVVFPEKHQVKWIVTANGDIGEPVYTSLVRNQKDRFLEFYDLVYKGNHGNIYKLRDDAQIKIANEQNN